MSSSEPFTIMGPRMIIGMIFGCMIAGSLIARPDHYTRKHLMYLITPLLAALNVWMAIYEPTKALGTLIWSMLFVAVHIAYLAAGRNDSSKCTESNLKE